MEVDLIDVIVAQGYRILAHRSNGLYVAEVAVEGGTNTWMKVYSFGGCRKLQPCMALDGIMHVHVVHLFGKHMFGGCDDSTRNRKGTT